MSQARNVKLTLLDLDDTSIEPWALGLTFKGTRLIIDRQRLEQLLALEQDNLARRISQAPAGDDDGRDPSLRPRQLPDDRVTHGSLSSRITKIYNYSKSTRTIRPTHAGLLGEFLAAFDWNLPEHTGNRIPTQLAEIVTWNGLTADLKRQIQSFLSRYATATASRKP